MNTNLPREKQTLLEHIVSELRVLPHVKAVVLGGSFATGYATATSDLDVGIYYHNAEPFAIEDVRGLRKNTHLIPLQPLQIFTNGVLGSMAVHG